MPFTLSVQTLGRANQQTSQSSRLLVTPYDGDALYIYNNLGQLVKQIILPEYMTALHAVETLKETYVVSHRARKQGDKQPSITELSENGEVLRFYDNDSANALGSSDDPLKVRLPVYLSLDTSHGHVLVADQDSERVLHLDSDLKLKQILLKAEPTKQPCRLWFSQRTGKLYVRYYNSQEISVYNTASTITKPE
jgi:DNA-binding beta-propeller fold protein YncE